MATGSDRHMPGHEIYEALGNRKTFQKEGRGLYNTPVKEMDSEDEEMDSKDEEMDLEDEEMDLEDEEMDSEDEEMDLEDKEMEVEVEEMEVDSQMTRAEEETCNTTPPGCSAPPQVLTLPIGPSGPPNNQWSGDNTQAMGTVFYNFLSNEVVTLVLDFIGYQWHPIVTITACGISQADNHQTQVESTQNTTRMVHLIPTRCTNGAREGGVILTATINPTVTLSTDNDDYATGTGRQCTDHRAGATGTCTNNRQFVIAISLPNVDTSVHDPSSDYGLEGPLN